MLSVPARKASQPVRDGDPVALELRRLSRVQHLERNTVSNTVDNNDLTLVWGILTRTAASNAPGDAADADPAMAAADSPRAETLTYEQFRACGQEVQRECAKFAAFFAPAVFLSLRGAGDLLSVNKFFDLVMRKVPLQQLRMALAVYDSQGCGYLTELDLENYVLDKLPALPQLANLDVSFFSTYTAYAVRKFFFFLDGARTRKIAIPALMLSPIMSEFTALEEDDDAMVAEERNWFSIPTVTRVYGMYCALDVQGHGLLGKAEFARFNGGSLTPAFVDRLFDEIVTFKGKMDLRGFIDFVLARENPHTEQSMQYFFRVLDVQHQGYLTLFSINFFWRALDSHPLLDDGDRVKLMDLRDEMFDMVKPADPLRITLSDLKNCGKGGTFCAVLTDVEGFSAYENREGS